ncbi:MAG: oxidoreductase [Cyclobacteriaceae bacterium]
MKTALVAGATGLVGRQLVSMLVESERYERIKCLTRTPVVYKSAKIINLVADLDSLPSQTESLKADDIFCCLGTTMKVAGSEEAFRQVDFDYPLRLAKLCKEQGAKQFLLVSALGADSDSKVFYNQVKGEVEAAISKVDFQSFHIFRPSLLLGPRTEQRAGEKAAKVVMNVFDFLIPKKYKAIESSKVARAMLRSASEDLPGKHMHESHEMQ